VAAVVAAERGDPERAAMLLGQADRLRVDSGVEVPAFQRQTVTAARTAATAALGDAAFAAALARGRHENGVSAAL
jgi:hypothetical protein